MKKDNGKDMPKTVRPENDIIKFLSWCEAVGIDFEGNNNNQEEQQEENQKLILTRKNERKR